jgi:tripartite-type tricarboxylate transporter receptor subunit TctC
VQVLPAVIAGAAYASHAFAQREGDDARAYPTRPVRIVIPFVPGSATDAMMRVLAPLLDGADEAAVRGRETLSGAGGVTGSVRVARSAPDGYTLLAASAGPVSVNPYIYDKLPYDPTRDFVPITTVGDSRWSWP